MGWSLLSVSTLNPTRYSLPDSSGLSGQLGFGIAHRGESHRMVVDRYLSSRGSISSSDQPDRFLGGVKKGELMSKGLTASQDRAEVVLPVTAPSPPPRSRQLRQ